MNYKLAYRIGFHPWEDAATQPEFNDRLAALSLPRRQGARRTGRRSTSAPAAGSGRSGSPDAAGK